MEKDLNQRLLSLDPTLESCNEHLKEQTYIIQTKKTRLTKEIIEFYESQRRIKTEINNRFLLTPLRPAYNTTDKQEIDV